uniref:Uncharacterized protein n=1 Tax=Zea mays TaxID=4577 RepID=B6SYN8_MAIZE|nr:hypothetical protein [Zea mays]
MSCMVDGRCWLGFRSPNAAGILVLEDGTCCRTCRYNRHWNLSISGADLFVPYCL